MIDGSEQKREGLIDYQRKEFASYGMYALGGDIYILNNHDILFWTYKGKKKYALGRLRPRN